MRSVSQHEKPTLTPELCQGIVVRNTPNPKHFKSTAQPLGQLGVIDQHQTKFHNAGIRASVREIQYTIDSDAINSGPAVTVSDCSASVQNGARWIRADSVHGLVWGDFCQGGGLQTRPDAEAREGGPGQN
jgi:hypothetical protein